MMISHVRRDTGLVPLFAASLDEFRVTIPWTSLITPELRAWAGRLSRGQDLSEAQISVLALASAGYDVDIALIRRLALARRTHAASSANCATSACSSRAGHATMVLIG
jgi:hypothetical protein